MVWMMLVQGFGDLLKVCDGLFKNVMASLKRSFY